LLILLALSGYCNDGSVYYNINTQSVVPINNNTIRMAEETVIFKDDKVATDFTFINDSNTIENATIGFPVLYDLDREGWGQYPGSVTKLSDDERLKKIENYFHFKSYLNGREIERKLVKADPTNPNDKSDNYAYVFDVSFKPNETINIKNEYTVRTIAHQGSNLLESWAFEYILTTGKLWKGTIGKVHISVSIPLSNPYVIESDNPLVFYFIESKYFSLPRAYTISVAPKGYRTVYNKPYLELIWDFENLEPDFNIKCRWDTSNLEPGGYYIGLDSLNEILDDLLVKKMVDIKKTKQFAQSLDSSLPVEKYLELIYLFFDALPETMLSNRKPEYRMMYLNLSRFYVNAIYALYGGSFQAAPAWQEFFSYFSWYKGTTLSPAFPADVEKKYYEIGAIRDRLKKVMGVQF